MGLFYLYLYLLLNVFTSQRRSRIEIKYFKDKIIVVCFSFLSLTFSDRTSNLVRQYDFPVPLRCRKTSDTAFVAFVLPLSKPVRRFSSCSTDFIQQIAQVVLFLILYDFLF
jgi:hypothetical protein